MVRGVYKIRDNGFVRATLQRETLVFSYYRGKLERGVEGHRLATDNQTELLEAVERTLAEMRQAVEQRANIQVALRREMCRFVLTTYRP
jgi:hypothetical protein